MMAASKKPSLIIMKAFLTSAEYSWSHRKAWWFTASSRTKERFSRTKLGSFWLSISNVLSMSILALVYWKVFNIRNLSVYIVYLGLGLTIWNSLNSAVQAGPKILTSHSDGIRNSNIRPIFYACEEWAFQIQTLCQSCSLVILFLSIFNPNILPNIFLYAPIHIFNLLLLMFWLPTILSILGSEYEDLYQLLPVCLQLLFLVSPILYQREALGSYMIFAKANILYIVLANLRDSCIHGNVVSGLSTVMLLIVNILMVVCSIALLEKRRSKLPFIV